MCHSRSADGLRMPSSDADNYLICMHNSLSPYVCYRRQARRSQRGVWIDRKQPHGDITAGAFLSCTNSILETITERDLADYHPRERGSLSHYYYGRGGNRGMTAQIQPVLTL